MTVRRALVAVVVLLLTGCSAPTPAPAPPPVPPETPITPAPPITPSPRATAPVPDVVPPGVVAPPAGGYTAQTLTWSPCRRGLECTRVLAPLDWADLTGRAVTLSVSRRPAQATPAAGVLFVNPGGPGGSGLDMPRTLPADGLAGFDIVGWDPRGVGESTPVRCLDDAGYDALYALDGSPDDQTEVRALEDGERTLGAACSANSGSLLSHVSTVDTVRDLDLLRQLLGAPTLNFYGASYGTVIGSLYAQLYPRQTGRLVLDGAVVLGEDTAGLQAGGFQQAFEAFAAWCADARACRLGDTAAAVQRTTVGLLNRLDTAPLAVGDRRLTQTLALDAIVQTLYGTATSYPLLSRIITAGVAGDGAPLLASADVANDRDDGRYGQLNAAFPSIRCLDQADEGTAAALADAQTVAQEVPGLGPFFGPDLTCPEWPVAAQPFPGRITAPNAPPILVVGTTGDPATPYASARQLSRQLESGRLLTLRGVGHTAYRQSGCIRDRVDAFLVAGTLPPDGTVC